MKLNNMPDQKIKCSVGILTLNSADGLKDCLPAFTDFDEVIVCDGNSTDNTVEVAKSFGAKVIKQYEQEGAKLRNHCCPEGIYESNSCGGMRFKSTFIGYNERYISIDLDFIPYHIESNTFAVQTTQVEQHNQGQLKLF